MNRIILIGNGFDLAHGMKTSYKDFIEDYWKKTIEEIKLPRKENSFSNNDINISWWPFNHPLETTYEDLMKSLEREKSKITYENRFLSIITAKNNINKWVDIEEEYYRLLKEAMNSSNKSYDNGNIEKLNKDFKDIQNKLAAYLKKVEGEFESSTTIDQKIRDRIRNIVYQKYDYNDFTAAALDEMARQELKALQELSNLIKDDIIDKAKFNSYRKNLIKEIEEEPNPLSYVKKYLKSGSSINYFDQNPKDILLLNFNYTNTDKQYKRQTTEQQLSRDRQPTIASNNIHGSIYEPNKNPIIFGYGDELDEEYKNIENLNENKYLENIKSINYLESGHYKSLLSFIESGYYEIFIFGHSCGISDRTLLNTMFEHDNCASIRVFFHERENGEDNYSDIVRNISRNFNDKAKMRDRVVNKRSCKPLIKPEKVKEDSLEILSRR